MSINRHFERYFVEKLKPNEGGNPVQRYIIISN